MVQLHGDLQADDFPLGHRAGVKSHNRINLPGTRCEQHCQPAAVAEPDDSHSAVFHERLGLEVVGTYLHILEDFVGRVFLDRPPTRQGTTVPSMSLSSVDAMFPAIEVLLIVAVATVKIPPPAPMLSGCVAPLVPLVGVPLEPPTVPPVPAVPVAQDPAAPPVEASAWLPVIRSVAFDCLKPFFVCSRGSITSVVAFAL